MKFRPHYSLRTLLLLVPLVAIGCWLWVRSQEFERRAHFHDEESIIVGFDFLNDFDWDRVHEVQPARNQRAEQTDASRKYHQALAEKYHRAARYPWLPVETDPPEPP